MISMEPLWNLMIPDDSWPNYCQSAGSIHQHILTRSHAAAAAAAAMLMLMLMLLLLMLLLPLLLLQATMLLPPLFPTP
jgi:hypothetical protein